MMFCSCCISNLNICASDIIFCILYFKIKNSNMCSVDTIKNDKNREYIFGSTVFKNIF